MFFLFWCIALRNCLIQNLFDTVLLKTLLWWMIDGALEWPVIMAATLHALTDTAPVNNLITVVLLLWACSHILNCSFRCSSETQMGECHDSGQVLLGPQTRGYYGRYALSLRTDYTASHHSQVREREIKIIVSGCCVSQLRWQHVDECGSHSWWKDNSYLWGEVDANG